LGKTHQNEHCLNRGRGRGQLVNLIKSKLNSESPKPLRITLNQPEEIKKNNILSNGAPVRSTYIPTEPDDNDESIYETGINSGINFEKFNEIEVKVSGQNIPENILKFEDCIFKELLQNIKKCKFTKPTPIQQYTIPIIVSGKDLMAAAQTGSGKTVIKYVFMFSINQKYLQNSGSQSMCRGALVRHNVIIGVPRCCGFLSGLKIKLKPDDGGD